MLKELKAVILVKIRKSYEIPGSACLSCHYMKSDKLIM